jgi:hypothetical protein
VLLFLLYGSSASALTYGQKRVAPPGNSGVSEYQEDIPSASGGHAVPSQKSLTPQPQVLPTVVTHQLAKTGKVGRKAAVVAEATAPPVVHKQTKKAASQAQITFSRLLRHQDGAVVDTLASSLAGDDGDLGVLLPVLLGASALLAAGLAFARRRSR